MDPNRSRFRALQHRWRDPQTRLVYQRRWAIALTAVVLAGWMLSNVLGAFDGSDAPRGEAAAGAGTSTTAGSQLCPPAGQRFPAPDETVPAALHSAIDVALSHRSFEVRPVGISIWVEGYGEVAASRATEPLAPASNQKILTAMGALELLDPSSRLVTELRASAPVDTDGVLDGDLVIVGGGDPLIKRTGLHSLEDIASRLWALGLRQVTGSVLGDESRYDQVRRAPGWLEWEMPLPGGSMSALMVNSNSRIGDKAYLDNPTQHNAELLREALEGAGITVLGGAQPGSAPPESDLLLAYESPTVAEIVQLMLRESDNMAAELLAKEIGLHVAGEGSTATGLDAAEEALESSLCVEIDGYNDDASGISRDNRRSARSWRELLLAAREAPWFETFYEGLPVAGEEGGTLATRFLGSEAAGDVVAKTGTIGTAVALSGYLETDGGREVVFSVVANGTDPEPAVAAMDQLIVTVAADRS